MFLLPVWDKTVRTTALAQGSKASKKATVEFVLKSGHPSSLSLAITTSQAAVSRRPNSQRNRGHPSSGTLGLPLRDRGKERGGRGKGCSFR